MTDVKPQSRRKATDFPPYRYNPYPRMMYHKDWPSVDPVIVENAEDEALIKEEGWAVSPAEHGKITAPSAADARIENTGVDFTKLREKRDAKLAAEEKASSAKEEVKKEEVETLLGSEVQPESFKLKNGYTMPLGDVVKKAFKASELETIAEWNELEQDERESFIQEQVTKLKLA